MRTFFEMRLKYAVLAHEICGLRKVECGVVISNYVIEGVWVVKRVCRWFICAAKLFSTLRRGVWDDLSATSRRIHHFRENTNCGGEKANSENTVRQLAHLRTERFD
jgi:hypothetical protein